MKTLDTRKGNMIRRGRHILGAVSLLAGALLAPAACGDETDVVQGSAVAFGTSSQALLAADLLSVNGKYTSCIDHADDDPWSLAIAGGAPLANAALVVVKDDTDCELTLVSLVTNIDDVDETMGSTPSIPLGTDFAVAASSFDVPIAFVANAALSSTDFAANFVLTILYSDDPATSGGNTGSSWVLVSGSASATSVDAPDYGVAIDLVITTNAEDVVQSATGDVDLTEGAVEGQTYVVVLGGGLVEYSAIDAAFVTALGALDVEPLPAAPIAIPASDFALGALDLTASPVRTLIIANTVEGVRAYQTFQITFNPAT